MKILKINSYSDIPENFSGIAEYPNGTKEYWINGKELTPIEVWTLHKVKINEY